MFFCDHESDFFLFSLSKLVVASYLSAETFDETPHETERENHLIYTYINKICSESMFVIISTDLLFKLFSPSVVWSRDLLIYHNRGFKLTPCVIVCHLLRVTFCDIFPPVKRFKSPIIIIVIIMINHAILF